MRSLSLIAAGLAALVAAHPGHDHTAEVQERSDALVNKRTNLAHCQDKMHESGLQQRAFERRAEIMRRHMKKRKRSDVTKRQQSFGEHQSSQAFTGDTDFATVFGGNNSCVMTPSSTEGPFYVTGEEVRADIVEGQEGIPLIVDFQLVDVTTCTPVEGAMMELWNANSTGVYSGIVSAMNGAGLRDQPNLEKTFLRGLQESDEHGAVQFHTIFPGHYTGRTVHIHVMAHIGVETHPNGTVSDVTPAHVAQLYFDQDLIAGVERNAPYNTNRQQLLTNARDYVLRLEPAGSDPFVHYTMLGDTLEDGLFGWFTFGIDASKRLNAQAAANRWEGGSRMNRINFGLFPSPIGKKNKA